MTTKYNLENKQKKSILFYGKNTLPAARSAIFFMNLGYEDVRILDGGYQRYSEYIKN